MELEKKDDLVQKDPNSFDTRDLDVTCRLAKTIHYLCKLHHSHNKEEMSGYGDGLSAEGELIIAEKLLKRYQETKNEVYIDIMKDEIRHAKIFIDMMEEGKEKDKCQEWYINILSRVPEKSNHTTTSPSFNPLMKK